MTTTDINKRIGVKHLGSDKATESLLIAPGTTAREILGELKLDPVGFQLSDARNPDIVFRPDDNVFARVADGDMLHVAASVIAGRRKERETTPWAA